MQENLSDPNQRSIAEKAVVNRLAQWRGEDAIELVRELNAIVARTYYSKWRNNG